MLRYIYAVIAILLFVVTISWSQYTVSDYSDLPDEDLDDNIFYPPTLRAAIENINKKNVPATIKILNDNANIKLSSGLYAIIPKVIFEGDGLVLEPANGAIVNLGLQIRGQYSEIRDVTFRNFNGTGLSWQASDGLIERVTSINNAGPGLNLNYAHRNTIGTLDFDGYASNYFYGATGTGGYGISLLWSDDNIIQYCAIGHNSNSERKPNSRSGINVSESYRTIIRKNVISGNDWNGIQLSQKNQTSECEIYENVIGLDRLKALPIYNGMNGISLTDTKGDQIYDNIVSGNVGNGIFIANASCDSIFIGYNIVGTDKTTIYPVPNGAGIRVNGTNHQVFRNIISGNWNTGLSISSKGDYRGNIIGLDSSQQFAVPNYWGVYILGSNITFGDPDGYAPNIIAGNSWTGVEIAGANNKNNWIVKNIIGTNEAQTIMFPNGGSGIKMTHSLRDIYIENNLIAASGWHGIEMIRNVVIFLDPNIPHLYQKPSNIHVYDNYIGWSPNESDTARIGGSGIYMYSVDTINIMRNYITGTDYSGIYLGNDSSRYVNIYSNDIGYDTNNELQRIKGAGIYIEEANDVIIGGYIADTHYNIIKNCDYSGIYLDRADTVVIENNVMHSLGGDGITIIGDSSSRHVRILSNTIGPAGDDEESKIQYSGIYVERGNDVEIGDILDDDANNIISYCKEYGIFITDSSREVYSFANRFINNELGGIALDSVINWYYDNGNFNDSLDADIGSNGLQNTLNAEIAFAEGDSLVLKSYFNGYPETIYGVEIYLAKIMPDSLKVLTQGDTFIERFNISTDATGKAAIDTTLKSSKIAQKSLELPFVTANVYSIEGSSGFSHITYVNPAYIDIAVEIETLESGADEYGYIKIYADIINFGNYPATDVTVRDTVSEADLLDVVISSGDADIEDSIFVAVIPTLNPGDSVRMTTIVKPHKFMNYNRIVAAVPAEVDVNLSNNLDSINIEIIPAMLNITLSQGWNMISSNIYPIETDMESIFDNIADKTVIVKNNIGQIFYPEFGINDIGDWEIENGYQVYMNSDADLSFSGFRANPQDANLTLSSGWNMIAYLRSNSLEIENALAPLNINDNLVIAKDNFGNIYFPAFGINTIGDMTPGQGYQLYILAGVIFNYPDN